MSRIEQYSFRLRLVLAEAKSFLMREVEGMAIGRKNWLGGFKHAFNGIVYCFITQRNMKVHAVAALLAVGLALYFQLSVVEWSLLILTIAAVVAAEMFNTAVEALVDLVSPHIHHLAKAAKDAAAGAVLVTAIAALLVGYFLFFHRLFG
ncbi:MAG: diacylglycerol kinase family protein [Negativicutes bacterium]|nr:diacylglycerol kinase family protein [Negativicutes bacterium]